MTVGYGIGLLNAWAVLWSATLLIFNDARGDFSRIREVEEALVDTDGAANPPFEAPNMQNLRARHVDGSASKSTKVDEEQKAEKSTKFIYQSLPFTLLERLDWVLDLVSNFRGVRWLHHVSGLPPPPPHIQSCLPDPKMLPPTAQSHLTRTDLLRRDLPKFLFCCLALDALKTITIQDPYFWSLPASTPSPFPFPRTSRLVLSLLFTYFSLLTVFLLAPLVFAVLLGPEYLGQHAWPWLYPPYFGSLGQVCKKGLAGFWSIWWHQLFRMAFEQAGEFVGSIFGWERNTTKGAMLRSLIAFACSGALHACASYTILGSSNPFGAFSFFLIQPVGIFAQKAVAAWLKKSELRERIPARVREAGNIIFVLVWCSLIGPWIADDFAAGGIWLYEPLPISLFRGLRGEGWWWWGGTWVTWHTAEKWWQSGLAF